MVDREVPQPDAPPWSRPRHNLRMPFGSLLGVHQNLTFTAWTETPTKTTTWPNVLDTISLFGLGPVLRLEDPTNPGVEDIHRLFAA